jgi:KDO2-lipid IV(A) lauroyltransferase
LNGLSRTGLLLGSRLPLSWLDRAAILFGTAGWHLGYTRSTSLKNLARAFPELPEKKQRRIGRESLCNFLRTIVEVTRLHRWSAEEIARHVTWVYPERLAAAQARGRGVLVLSAHLGNFELIGISGNALRHATASLIGRDLHTSVADGILKRSRNAHGVLTISPHGAYREVIRHLRQKRDIGVVLDQRAKRGDAVWVRFFGQPAATMPTLALLAERTGAPVVPIFACRKGPNRHEILVYPEIPFVDTGNHDDNLLVNTQRYTWAIERLVRLFPEQWLWAHERWRSSRWPRDLNPEVPEIEDDLLQSTCRDPLLD